MQVLRLIETFPLAIVHGAVRDALRLGAINYDAVKHLALTTVTTTSASSYLSPLSGTPT